jgi:hypothetical protein
MTRRAVIVVHAVLAASISLVTGWVGSGVLLCLVAPMLLVRFVWLDRETTMFGAMTFTAVLAVMGLSERGTSGAITVALGGFIAAEVAARGARVRRAAPLPRLRGDLLPTVGVGVAAAAVTVAAAALTRWRPPAALAVAGLALLVTGLFVVILGRPDRDDSEPDAPHLQP